MKSKILDLSIDHSRQYKKQLRSQTSGGMPKEKKPSQRYKKKPKKLTQSQERWLYDEITADILNRKLKED